MVFLLGAFCWWCSWCCQSVPDFYRCNNIHDIQNVQCVTLLCTPHWPCSGRVFGWFMRHQTNINELAMTKADCIWPKSCTPHRLQSTPNLYIHSAIFIFSSVSAQSYFSFHMGVTSHGSVTDFDHCIHKREHHEHCKLTLN